MIIGQKYNPAYKRNNPIRSEVHECTLQITEGRITTSMCYVVQGDNMETLCIISCRYKLLQYEDVLCSIFVGAQNIRQNTDFIKIKVGKVMSSSTCLRLISIYSTRYATPSAITPRPKRSAISSQINQFEIVFHLRIL